MSRRYSIEIPPIHGEKALFPDSLIARQGYSLHREGYAKQSALIRQLFDSLNKPESREALKKNKRPSLL